MSAEKHERLLHFHPVAVDTAEFAALCEWVKENVDDYDLRTDFKTFAVMRNGEIEGVVQMGNMPMMLMGYKKSGNVHSSLRMFQSLYSVAEMQGINPLVVVDEDSPLYDPASKIMHQWPDDKKLFNLRG